jgi:hypothetical protein
VLRRLRFELTRCLDVGQQRKVHEDALPPWLVLRELADRLEEGQALDIAHRAADLAEHEIDLILADGDEVLDFIGDVGDHLDRFAKVIAAALLLQHVGIDAARTDRIRLARGDAGEAFVMAEVEVGLRPVIGDEDLAMFEGAHRAGVDVEIGIELAKPDGISPRLQQRPERGGGQTLAKR